MEVDLCHYLVPDPDLTLQLRLNSAVKRLAQLTQVRILLECGKVAPEVIAHLSALMAVLDDELVTGCLRRFSSPIFRSWLHRIVASLCTIQSFDQVFADLWYAPNMKVGKSERDLVLPAIGGVVSTWDPAIAFGTSGSCIRLEACGDRYAVYAQHQKSPSLLIKNLWARAHERPTITEIDKRVVFLKPACVDNMDVVIRNDIPHLRLKLYRFVFPERYVEIDLDLNRVRSETYPPFDAGEFQEALAILQTIWPEMFGEFGALVQVIVPLVPPRGWTLNGYTISSFQGACWIGVRGVMQLLEHLVHECSHIKLRYVEEFLPILEKGQTDMSFRVGWREDPRPIQGIFEGVFVGVHSITALAFARHAKVFSGDMLRAVQAREEELRVQVLEALPILDRNARFTAWGEVFISWAHERLAEV